MKKHKLLIIIVLIFIANTGFATKIYKVQSPDKKIVLTVEIDSTISWSININNKVIVDKSQLSLTLLDGEVLGENSKISKVESQYVNTIISPNFYKKNEIQNQYNQLSIKFRNDWKLLFRAYNDGVAYRFVINKKKEQTVVYEKASFNFNADYKCFVPYVCDLRDKNDQYCSAFESLYDNILISQFKTDSLSQTPLLVDVKDKNKVAILEADLQDYPGMFLTVNKKTMKGFEGRFAHYPLEEKIGGFQNLNLMPTKRADYIAKVSGMHQFPWRVVIISTSDKELLNSDIVYKLSTPSKIEDTSWIKPGKVSWDWWNNWNISGVDFKAGINTETYKYYIDFASKNKLEYIILDEGWSASTVDVINISPTVNLQELIDYAKKKNVGIILWASWRGITANLDEAFEKYCKMGIKGFKIDFIDRDDQKMVKSCFEIALKAAKLKLLIDFHGMFKPSGMQVTYPNILNFEGVRGLENCKWYTYDAPGYDATMPFIRMLSGPVDYTPGAMRNAAKNCFRPINDNPMSAGTRCHQLAMYVVFEAPLQMLADNPTTYSKEQESTNFIENVPTVFDETVPLDGEVGNFLTIARRKGDTWFVGALCNWNAKSIFIDFSFLPSGNFDAEIFSDGKNADRDGTDYKREIIIVNNTTKLEYQLASGGGLAIKINKSKQQ